MKILEKRFRGAQVCQVLSYPIAYGIVKLLLDKGKMSLEEITKETKRTKATVCFHLTKLRLAHLIRYERTGKKTYYWIKYKEEVNDLLNACERSLKRVSKKLEKDS